MGIFLSVGPSDLGPAVQHGSCHRKPAWFRGLSTRTGGRGQRVSARERSTVRVRGL